MLSSADTIHNSFASIDSIITFTHLNNVQIVHRNQLNWTDDQHLPMKYIGLHHGMRHHVRLQPTETIHRHLYLYTIPVRRIHLSSMQTHQTVALFVCRVLKIEKQKIISWKRSRLETKSRGESFYCLLNWMGKKTDWFGRLIACTSYSQFTKHKLSKKEEKKPTETKPNWLYMHYCNIQNAKHSTFNALCSL